MNTNLTDTDRKVDEIIRQADADFAAGKITQEEWDTQLAEAENLEDREAQPADDPDFGPEWDDAP